MIIGGEQMQMGRMIPWKISRHTRSELRLGVASLDEDDAVKNKVHLTCLGCFVLR